MQTISSDTKPVCTPGGTNRDTYWVFKAIPPPARLPPLQDADTGTMYTTFPPVLMLHLKRFQFNKETYNQEKVLPA